MQTRVGQPPNGVLGKLRDLLEMIRFSHTVFALPFALFAAGLAWATPVPGRVAAVGSVGGVAADARLGVPFRWQDLAGILVCMVTARSAAMAFNRLADRRIDALNPRTRTRHLPAGRLSVFSVTVFTAVNVLLFVAGTLLFWPNRLPLLLSVPVLLWLLGYSYTKRFTWLAHYWLGAALMLAPICTWIALRGSIVIEHPSDVAPALWLGLAVLSWVSGFDILYACQDADFDRRARLHSVPARWGIPRALRIAAACHGVTVVALAALPLACPQVPLGGVFLSGVAAVALLLAYEHWLVRPDDLSRVGTAFFHVNAVISLGLLVIGTLDLVL
jgi:4-hydroxybenzoate polyprenyltransferase